MSLNFDNDKNAFLEPLLRKLRIKKIKKHIPFGARVLDLGCGFDGRFLREIKDRISFGLGIDKKTEDANIDNLIFKKGFFDNIDKIEQKGFDCVTLLAVIEHMDNPEELLARIPLLMKSEGCLIVTTPAPCARPLLNFLSFTLNLVSKDEIREHKRYFGKNDLIALMEKCGFVVIRYKRFEFGFNSLCIAQLKSL
jgi:2-polyprenyl-3-methyl-5-hydroxy-6-metoxy-1,4-benzoquinol methylase